MRLSGAAAQCNIIVIEEYTLLSVCNYVSTLLQMHEREYKLFDIMAMQECVLFLLEKSTTIQAPLKLFLLGEGGAR